MCIRGTRNTFKSGESTLGFNYELQFVFTKYVIHLVYIIKNFFNFLKS